MGGGMIAILEWFSADTALASSWNRRSSSGDVNAARWNISATDRSGFVSCAL
jgi:hypothetical protein